MHRWYVSVKLHLLGQRIANGFDEATDLVAHSLCSDTSGGGLEVHLTLTPQAGRFATWHEGIHARGARTVSILVVVDEGDDEQTWSCGD